MRKLGIALGIVGALAVGKADAGAICTEALINEEGGASGHNTVQMNLPGISEGWDSYDVEKITAPSGTQVYSTLTGGIEFANDFRPEGSTLPVDLTFNFAGGTNPRAKFTSSDLSGFPDNIYFQEKLADGNYGTGLDLREGLADGEEIYNFVGSVSEIQGRIVYPPAGDTDFDGDVDWADYQMLEDKFGENPYSGPEDIDNDGDVDWADYQILEANFGEGTYPLGGGGGNISPLSGAVPEPSTGGLVGALIVAASLTRRKRHRS